jgi:hypothetical protein
LLLVDKRSPEGLGSFARISASLGGIRAAEIILSRGRVGSRMQLIAFL